MPFPLAAIGIHLDLNRLAWIHVSKLRLLKVGSYPDIIQRHNVHQILSNTHVLPHLDTSLADDSRDG